MHVVLVHSSYHNLLPRLSSRPHTPPMSTSLPLHRLAAFLLQGSTSYPPSELQLHLLRGWKDSTLLSYNAAVQKFIRFLVEDRSESWVLPASPNDIYGFCFWAGRTKLGPTSQDVAASTLKKYLFGIQAWHTFHDMPYPTLTNSRVAVLLRACGRQDALTPARPLKSPVMLKHLLLLYHTWIDGSDEDVASLDCVLVAFWGMMRLAEVAYDNHQGQPQWLNSVLCKDVLQSEQSSSITLSVRGAKTAKAGVPQLVLLNKQPNDLCPVKAVTRCLNRMRSPSDALFGYGGDSPTNLTRSRLVNKCTRVWVAHGWLGLSGHSFRVGGASFRAALGVPHEDIKRLGRWTSDCYKLYLRDYSDADMSESITLLRFLNRGGS